MAGNIGSPWKFNYLAFLPLNRHCQDKCWTNVTLLVTVVRDYDFIVRRSYLTEVAAVYINLSVVLS